jgi:hypothetical protein
VYPAFEPSNAVHSLLQIAGAGVVFAAAVVDTSPFAWNFDQNSAVLPPPQAQHASVAVMPEVSIQSVPDTQ